MGGLLNNRSESKENGAQIRTNVKQVIWSSQEAHEVVTEAEGAKINANISTLPLKNNNHQKEAEAVNALSKSEIGTKEERGINIKIESEVSTIK